jgi:hypothetical protein
MSVTFRASSMGIVLGERGEISLVHRVPADFQGGEHVFNIATLGKDTAHITTETERALLEDPTHNVNFAAATRRSLAI